MKGEIFLSASVPVPERGDFYKDADPFLIHMAVRELLTTTLGRRTIVWGGHPAITPMVWAVCEDLGVDYADTVVLYQSKFFQEFYPEENRHFKNVEYIDGVDGDQSASLSAMRIAMLSRPNIEAAVFIGGMQGIFSEWKLFNQLHSGKPAIAVGAVGGASKTLARELQEEKINELDFVSLFHERLKIPFDSERSARPVTDTAIPKLKPKPPGGNNGP